ncbi:hypothetical protein [Peribacillus alkalitolerans]|uniref:hypothetical protein n=1 Tax=Peribacillus alkalitolerans TaxID=1550385 RepID=UPI0013D1AB65|nr:hypothetical protein [Peribacillus alkalitolerans]
MEIIIGFAGMLFILFIINSFLSIEKELRKLNRTNEKIVEILKEIKKEPFN